MRRAIPALAALLMLGCRAYDREAYTALLDGGAADARDGQAALEGGVDAPDDAGVDGAADAAMDAAMDVARDVTPDSATDARLDAAVDATDAGVDAPLVAMDAADVGVDAPVATGDAMDAADAPGDVPADARADTSPADTGCVPRLVVNEVSTLGTGGGRDEFAEVANVGACAVSLAGWTLRVETPALAVATVWTGAGRDSVAAGGYFLVSGLSYMGPSDSQFTGDYAGGTSALPSSGGAVGLFDPAGGRVDGVGYQIVGGALSEGVPVATNPPSGESIARIPNGVDTDNNSVDFRVVTAPTPRRAN